MVKMVKKGSVLFLAFLMLLVVNVRAQEGSEVYNQLIKQYDKVVYHDDWGEKCYEIKKDRYAGCCDKNGNVIIPPTKYMWLSYYSDIDVFVVNFNSLLDGNGKVLMEAGKYDYLSWESATKVYQMRIGDKMGLLDRDGKVLIEAEKYDYVSLLSDGMYLVHDGDKVGLLDKNGKELILVKGRHINYDSVDKCFMVFQREGTIITAITLYSPEGRLIFDSKTMNDIGVVSEGLIAIQENGLWGYMDVTNGAMVIPAQYTSADKFEDGMAKVSKGNESFLISHPLRGGGSEVLSSLSISQEIHNDIDENIYETKVVDENAFAVVLSVQNYSDFVVPFAESDGKVFRQYCEKSLGIPKSNVIYFEDATLNNIHSAMSRIADLADAYEGDARIIFYFAGQGVTDNAGNPYLLPSDASMNMIATTGYSVEKLFRELGDLDVQSAIVLLDAGFTNESREGKEIIKDGGASVRTKHVPVTGKVAALFASSEGEPAYVAKDKGHGMFTYFLCKKIKESKGNVNLQELSDYLRTSVVKATKEKTNKTQTPQIISANSIILKDIKL